MDLLESLKKLKSIDPDRGFSVNSRNLILNTPTKIKLGVFGVILRNLELGAALALAGLLIFLTIGGFSAWNFLSPMNIANPDLAGIRAEAQAIDIQIKLTDLSYAESTSTFVSESTKISATAPIMSKKSPPKTQGARQADSQETISITEALEKLSE